MAPTAASDNIANKGTPLIIRSQRSPVKTRELKVKRVLPACGRRPMHSRQHCPAEDAECHRCHKRGGYWLPCKTKDIRNVDAEDSHFCSTYLDILTEDQRSASVAMGQWTLTFKVDTGAEMTAINERAFHELEDIVLEKSSQKLYGPSRSALQVIGHFTHTLQYTSRQDNPCLSWSPIDLVYCQHHLDS